MDEQGGFKAGRGRVDHVFVVRQVVKKNHRDRQGGIHGICRQEKAYDNVSREKLWMALKEHEVEGKLPPRHHTMKA